MGNEYSRRNEEHSCPCKLTRMPSAGAVTERPSSRRARWAPSPHFAMTTLVRVVHLAAWEYCRVARATTTPTRRDPVSSDGRIGAGHQLGHQNPIAAGRLRSAACHRRRPSPLMRFSRPIAICCWKNASVNCGPIAFVRPVCLSTSSSETPLSEKPMSTRE